MHADEALSDVSSDDVMHTAYSCFKNTLKQVLTHTRKGFTAIFCVTELTGRLRVFYSRHYVQQYALEEG